MIFSHVAHGDSMSHVFTVGVLTLLSAHSLLAISSCSYLRETTAGLWCLLFRGDTVSAASRGDSREGNIQSTVKSYMIQKSDFSFSERAGMLSSGNLEAYVYQLQFKADGR